MLDDLRQFRLVVWRVKAAVERSPLDAIAEPLLQGAHFGNQQVAFIRADGQHFPVADKTDGVFDDHHLVAKLDRRTRFAALDQFRIRLEQAEQFVGVGNGFAFDHATISRAADVLGDTVPIDQLLVQLGRVAGRKQVASVVKVREPSRRVSWNRG